MTTVSGIMSTQKPDYSKFNHGKIVRGCDLPEQGGIGGNIGKFDKPIPGAMEERPKMIDPKTGEWVYCDVYYKEHLTPDFIKASPRFSTTA